MDRNKTEQKITEMFKKIFKIENPDKNMHFSELGGKSVDAMKFQIELRKQFGVKIDFRTIYKLGSVETLAEYIAEKLAMENK